MAAPIVLPSFNELLENCGLAPAASSASVSTATPPAGVPARPSLVQRADSFNTPSPADRSQTSSVSSSASSSRRGSMVFGTPASSPRGFVRAHPRAHHVSTPTMRRSHSYTRVHGHASARSVSTLVDAGIKKAELKFRGRIARQPSSAFRSSASVSVSASESARAERYRAMLMSSPANPRLAAAQAIYQ